MIDDIDSPAVEASDVSIRYGRGSGGHLAVSGATFS
ncbi:MAG: hypothetical protein JWR53_1427, partial [Glaciihabitans sp.]|nr:hypothetical protein [Glaciihabitans sp.]